MRGWALKNSSGGLFLLIIHQGHTDPLPDFAHVSTLSQELLECRLPLAPKCHTVEGQESGWSQQHPRVPPPAARSRFPLLICTPSRIPDTQAASQPADTAEHVAGVAGPEAMGAGQMPLPS